MDYFEYTFTVTPVQPGSEILTAHLAELGFDMFEETATGTKAYIPSELYNDEVTQQIQAFKSEFSFPFTYDCRFIKAENWNALWESNFQPVLIADKCYIRAPFHEAKPIVQHEIVIEPKMSFGTGHHQTTSLVIAEMLKLDFTGKSVLDMGCGTAVLGILASKSGAKNIVGIDIDEWAYLNSIENCERNHISNMEIQQGGAELLGNTSFDVILANINKNIILRDISQYNKVLNAGGTIILSGFLDVDVEDIAARCAHEQLTVISCNKKEHWSVMVLTK